MVFCANFKNISWRPTYRKSLTSCITLSCIEYTSPWAGFEFTTVAVIGTDCRDSCKSNYYTITTTTARLTSMTHASCVFTFLVPCCEVRYDLRIKTMFGSYLPPVVCRRAHVLFRMFGSYLPPVVCRRGHVLFRMFGSYLSPVVCRRGHVLFMMFGSYLPPVVCRRGHVLFRMFGSS
jgi:hypothetical protein